MVGALLVDIKGYPSSRNLREVLESDTTFIYEIISPVQDLIRTPTPMTILST